ncbi:phospho-N-acetylmuramoyl-pentapeptide-transferase [bacterium]|nr:phospho-N-acetylmuramoyl-pentapeptide-transferase [bacterium]
MTIGWIFLATLPCYWGLIVVLRVLKGVQRIYELSPAQHQGKSGTVSMGGIGIVCLTILASVATRQLAPTDIFLLAVLAGFGIVGFMDDVMSIRRRKNLGLTASYKFLIQLGVSVVMVLAFHTWIRALPVWQLGWYVFMMTGFSNATNLTDGLDGLLGGLSLITLGAFLIGVSGVAGASIIGVAMAVVAGFLVFNVNPAKVFMGDTGSLALGAFFVALSMVINQPFIMLILGGVYVIETLSVILQVLSFKWRGKRVFRMAPLHHHFELMGWSERKVVTVFWVGGMVCSGLAWWIFN